MASETKASSQHSATRVFTRARKAMDERVRRMRRDEEMGGTKKNARNGRRKRKKASSNAEGVLIFELCVGLGRKTTVAHGAWFGTSFEVPPNETVMAVHETSGRYAEFMHDGSKVVRLSFVSKMDEMEQASGYSPEFVYQYFGENETIFGYKDLQITLYYSDASMYIYPQISYSVEISSISDQFKADNIMHKISEQLPIEQPKILCYTAAIFKARLDEQKNFRPYGELLSKFSSDGKEMQVWKVSESSPSFDEYMARVETLALWYIEAAQYTDNDDPRWLRYLLYESVKEDDGGRRLALAGYASLVRFYHHPDKIRARIAQILVLPQYRGVGNGVGLLQAIYSDLIKDPKVHDITAEDPAESFIRIRDFVDCRNCLTLNEFCENNLKKGFNEDMKNAALSRFKINPKQARRVYEILRLLYINARDEKEMKEYRIDVKRRLEKPFKRDERDWKKLAKALDEFEYATVVANQMSQEQKMVKLQQLYEEEIAGYQKVIKRLTAVN